MLRRRTVERGASAVEFALVVPLLIMMVFGIMSYGIIFAQQLALGNGAREAARYGVVAGRTCDQITTAAKDASNTISMAGANVTVVIKRGATMASATNACASGSVTPCTGSTAGQSLYVETKFRASVIIPLAVNDSFDIYGKGVFRCEYS